MTARFIALGDCAVPSGASAILFTCSAFGPCIEAVARRHPSLPALKRNAAMIEGAVAPGPRIGLVATFAPTLLSMPPEFPRDVALETLPAEEAMAALNAGAVSALKRRLGAVRPVVGNHPE